MVFCMSPKRLCFCRRDISCRPNDDTRGDKTFAAAGPRLWNSLPVQLRNPDITHRQLKGHLFGNHGHGAL